MDMEKIFYFIFVFNNSKGIEFQPVNDLSLYGSGPPFRKSVI